MEPTAGSFLLGDWSVRVERRGFGQLAFGLMIEFLVLPVGLSGLLPKLIGTTHDFNPAWLGHDNLLQTPVSTEWNAKRSSVGNPTRRGRPQCGTESADDFFRLQDFAKGTR